ncbi:MAG TPA: cell division protein ZapE [Nevskiaceae bacterium]
MKPPADVSPAALPLAGSPLAEYERKLASGEFIADEAQRRAATALQTVYTRLLAHPPHRHRFGRRRKWPRVPGLYLWGGVGRGKTTLMDSFYAALPARGKLRTHFHRFMLDVQERLEHYRDQQDPLVRVAAEIAAETRVLCFDEFQVFDIADAMILGRLLGGLFAHGVTLVATSNVAPDALYRDGLQREQFLPAIAALKQNCVVLDVDGTTDYRLRALHRAPVYLSPDGATAQAKLTALFTGLCGRAPGPAQDLHIHDREIHALHAAPHAVWFRFADLCEGPRGTADYVEIADRYPTVFLSSVPRFDASREAAARRFINLVDELYDRGVKLVVTAAAPPARLYAGKRLSFEFERTASRLLEMQSREYLSAPRAARGATEAAPALADSE